MTLPPSTHSSPSPVHPAPFFLYLLTGIHTFSSSLTHIMPTLTFLTSTATSPHSANLTSSSLSCPSARCHLVPMVHFRTKGKKLGLGVLQLGSCTLALRLSRSRCNWVNASLNTYGTRSGLNVFNKLQCEQAFSIKQPQTDHVQMCSCKQAMTMCRCAAANKQRPYADVQLQTSRDHMQMCSCKQALTMCRCAAAN